MRVSESGVRKLPPDLATRSVAGPLGIGIVAAVVSFSSSTWAVSPGPSVSLTQTETEGTAEEVLERSILVHSAKQVLELRVERAIIKGNRWVALYSDDNVVDHETGPLSFALGMTLSPGVYLDSTLVTFKLDGMDVPTAEWHDSYFRVDDAGKAVAISLEEYSDAYNVRGPCPGNVKATCIQGTVDPSEEVYQLEKPPPVLQPDVDDGGEQ